MKHAKLLCYISKMVEREVKNLEKTRAKLRQKKPTPDRICEFYYLSGRIDALKSI